MKTRRITTFLLAVALSCALPLAAPAQQESPPLPAGTPAPAFVTKTVSGKPLSLKSLRGRVVLLDYWGDVVWAVPDGHPDVAITP